MHCYASICLHTTTSALAAALSGFRVFISKTNWFLAYQATHHSATISFSSSLLLLLLAISYIYPNKSGELKTCPSSLKGVNFHICFAALHSITPCMVLSVLILHLGQIGSFTIFFFHEFSVVGSRLLMALHMKILIFSGRSRDQRTVQWQWLLLEQLGKFECFNLKATWYPLLIEYRPFLS